MYISADGAAAVEILRAELARAKEQARFSNAAAENAFTELKAEQAARHQYEEKVSSMTLEPKEPLAVLALLSLSRNP